MNPHIFRKDDIRGIVDQDWDEKDAEIIGQAFGSWLKSQGSKETTLGFDNRLSTPKLHSTLTKGLTAAGVDVHDLGMVTTPMVYFSRHHLRVDGGVMITGSHNPPQWNGLKLCQGKGTIFGEDIQEIRKICEKGKMAETKEKGKVKKVDLKDDYLGMIKEKIRPLGGGRKLKVVVDSFNGLAGLFAPELLRDLGCEVIELHSRPDGTFPHRALPDPAFGPNLQEISETVKREKADLGIAFDPDVDRLNAVDETGFTIWGDGLVMLFAREVLEKHYRAEILYNTQCSPAVAEDIALHGGVPIMVPTGHSTIENLLRFHGGLFAGEYKGHMFFADEYFGFDDAIYAAARLVRILQKSKKPLSKLMSDVPFYESTGEIIIPCPDEEKFEIAKKVIKSLKRKYFVIEMEAARIKFHDGLEDAWGLVRASNTFPKVQIFAWAKSQEDMGRIRDIMMAEAKRYL